MNSQKEKLKPYVITEKCPDDELVNAELTKLIAEGNELNQKIEAIIKELGE